MKSEGPILALTGNPNTGKSTVFNALTGMRQHTGNWPGKTVRVARGTARHRRRIYTVVDLPGTYSLLANSAEEEVASDFLCLAGPDVVCVVVDATCLERNLNLVLQVMEVTDRLVVLLNLVDEAEHRGYAVDAAALSRSLGVPVVASVARDGRGLSELMDVVEGFTSGALATTPRRVVYPPDIEEALQGLEKRLALRLPVGASARWLAVRALCGDPALAGLLDEAGTATWSPARITDIDGSAAP